MSSRRLAMLLGMVYLVFGGLALRLVQLQVVQHERFLDKAERRRRSLDIVSQRRGRLLDRRGRVLAVDRPHYEICVRLTELDPALTLAHRIARAIRRPRDEIVGAVQRSRGAGRAGLKQVLVARGLDPRAMRRARALAKRRRELEIDAQGVRLDAKLIDQRDDTLTRLARLLGHSPATLIAAVEERQREIMAFPDVYQRLQAWAEPHKLGKNVSFENGLAVQEILFDLPGVIVRTRFSRFYPEGDSASHVLGHLGRIPSAQYDELAKQGRILNLPIHAYRRLLKLGTLEPGAPFLPDMLLLGLQRSVPDGARLHRDRIGRTGLESRYDRLLAGAPGVSVVERDHSGRRRGVIWSSPERHGRDIRMTLDLELQRAAELSLDEALTKYGDSRAGAGAVVLDVRSGAILALASAPRMPLNELGAHYAELLSDPRHPLVSRAVSAMPPGSTFKLVTALGLFHKDATNRLPLNQHFECAGALALGRQRFRCDGVHGQTGLVRAIEDSCNVFFWRGVGVGEYDDVRRWALRLGFGARSGRGIPGEKAGVIPDRDSRTRRLERARVSLAYRRRLVKERRQVQASLEGKEREQVGEEIASLQRKLVAARDWAGRCAQDRRFTEGNERNAVIGQGGVLATPIQVARLAAFIGSGGRLVTPHLVVGESAPSRRYPVSPALMRTLQKGLRRVVTQGTASSRAIGLRELDVAGKTGTAERRKDQPNYAWFMGYYPSRNPRIAFAIVVDRTKGHGGGVTGPVAREIVKAWRRLESTG